MVGLFRNLLRCAPVILSASFGIVALYSSFLGVEKHVRWQRHIVTQCWPGSRARIASVVLSLIQLRRFLQLMGDGLGTSQTQSVLGSMKLSNNALPMAATHVSRSLKHKPILGELALASAAVGPESVRCQVDNSHLCSSISTPCHMLHRASVKGFCQSIKARSRARQLSR